MLIADIDALDSTFRLVDPIVEYNYFQFYPSGEGSKLAMYNYPFFPSFALLPPLYISLIRQV